MNRTEGGNMHTAKVVLIDNEAPKLEITCRDKEHEFAGQCPLVETWGYDWWDAFKIDKDDVVVEGEFPVHLEWNDEEIWIVYGEDPKQGD